MPLQNKSSLVSLIFIHLLERFSYYGSRAILILYMTAGDGLMFSQAEGVDFYSYFTLGVMILILPMGIFSDFVTGQKRGLIIGMVLTAIGNFVILIQGVSSFYIGVILIGLGVGLFRPNLIVLLGNLYDRKDKQRDVGFLFYLVAVNLGSFLGILMVGLVGEKIGWSYGFGLSGFAMILAAVVFHLGYQEDRNTEEETSNIFLENKYDDILDMPTPSINNEILTRAPLKIITVLVLFVLYKFLNEWLFIFKDPLEMQFYVFDYPGGTNPLQLQIQNLEFFGILAISVIFAIFWSRKNTSSSLTKINFGFFIFAIIGLLLYCWNMMGAEHQGVFFLISLSLLFGIAEVLVYSISWSFYTRLIPPKMASTFVGLFLVIPYSFYPIYTYFIDENIYQSDPYFILKISSAALLIGILVYFLNLFFQKKSSPQD